MRNRGFLAFKYLAAILLLVPQAGAQTVISDLVLGGIRRKAIRMPFDSVSSVERVCRQELAKYPNSRFLEVTVYGERGGAPLPPPLSAYTYEYWRSFYDRLSELPSEVAELVSFGGNAVLRLRDRDGNVSRKVLKGKDPLRIETGQESFEILYFALTAPSVQHLQVARKADIYARTASDLTASRGMRLLSYLRPIFRELEVYVYIRNDEWFLFESNYPFRNPFLPTRIPLSEQEHSETRTLRCGPFRPDVTCF